MPMGPYKDFAACVSAQKKKGKSDKSAKSICGSIKKKTEGGEIVKEEDVDRIITELWISDTLEQG